jgi:ribonuclease R
MAFDPETIASQLVPLLSGAGRPMKPKELARDLKIPTGDYRRFKRMLDDLEKEGRIYRSRGNRYAVPRQINLVVGRLQVIRSGDGFVVPDEGGEDVYVPSSGLESAMDGDQVVARVEGTGRNGRPAGRIVKVLKRARPTLVGRFRRTRSVSFVEPSDRRFTRDVLVGEGDDGGAKPGDIVLVRLTAFGDRRLPPVGEVERVLGAPGDAGVDVLSILFGHGLPLEFPPEVEASAQQARALVDEPGEDRVDHTGLLVFTIDPEDAKDHDDALSVIPVGEGAWEVGVHIADVSHFVRPGSPVDVEALSRGTSVYLVDRVVPMLPHTLSSDLCSLRPHEDRLAVSLFARLDESGVVSRVRFERTRIRSRHRLSYEDVQAVLDGVGAVDEETDEAIRLLARLAGKLRAERASRGSLDFDLPEAKVLLDAEGAPLSIIRRERLEAHRLIEDFMLLANEIVARRAAEKKIPLPFRVHEPPGSDKLDKLREFVNTLGRTLPDRELQPRDLQKLLDSVRGRPEEGLISTVVLRSMTRARYTAENLGHFGLASENYTHFTSPIRRYPDLVVHRAVVGALVPGSGTPRVSSDGMEEMAAHASERERLADQAERDSIALKKIEYMERHLGEEFDGTVSGVTAFGFFVLLDKVFVDGLVHVSSLGDDFYRFREKEYALVGERRGRRIRLGDRARVRVARIDREERRVDFVLVEGRR